MERQVLDTVVAKFAASLNITQHKVLHKNCDNTSFGKNYLGAVIPLTIEGVKGGEKVRYDVVIKIAPDNKILGNFIDAVYESEIHTYVEMLPFFREVCPEFVYPECYYTEYGDTFNFLVIQDMTVKGYDVKKETFLDLQHAMSVVDNIAKYHAIFLHIEENNAELYDKFKKLVAAGFNYANIVRFLTILNNAYKTILSAVNEESQKILRESLVNFENDVTGDLNTRINYNVLSHGDMWKNNILFKYENGQPSSVCFVDYQMMIYGPATRDLLYFLATSVEPDTRREHFQHFVSRYHNSLNTHLKQFNSNHKEVPLESIVKDIKTVAPFVLTWASFAFKNWLEIVDSNDDLFERVKSADLESKWEKFREIIEQLILDFKYLQLI